MKQKGRAGDRFLFLLPTSLVLLLIIVIPFLLSFYLSLTSWNGVSPRLEFVGLQNFKEILAKPGFFTSLSFTCRISVVVVILVNTIGVLLAALLTNGLKGSSFFRAGYYLPGTMGGIVVGFIWQFILIQGFPAIGQAFHILFQPAMAGNHNNRILGNRNGLLLAVHRFCHDYHDSRTDQRSKGLHRGSGGGRSRLLEDLSSD